MALRTTAWSAVSALALLHAAPAGAQQKRAVVAVVAASRADELAASAAMVRLEWAVGRDRRYAVAPLGKVDADAEAKDGAREESARKALAEALKRYDRVDLRGALSMLDGARQELDALPVARALPLHVQALFVQSLVNVANGRLSEARSDLARLLALRPDHAFDAARATPAFQRQLQQVREVAARAQGVKVPVTAEGAAASVALDGAPVCISPCALSNVLPGRHVVTLTAPGFRRWQEWITVTPGFRVSAKLQPEGDNAVPLRLETLRAAWSEGDSGKAAGALALETGADEALVGRVRQENGQALLSLGRVEKDGHVAGRVVVPLAQTDTPEFDVTVQRLLDKTQVRDGGRPVVELEGADIPPLPARKLAGRVLLGAGVAAAGGGVALGLQAQAWARAAAAIPQDQPDDYARMAGQARLGGLGSDVLYGLAGAALVTGVVLTLLPEPPAHLQLASLQAAPVLLPAGGAVAVAGSF